MYSVMYLLNIKNSLEDNIRRGSGNNEVISDSIVQSADDPAVTPVFELPSISSLPSLPTITTMDIESEGRRASDPEPKRNRYGPFDGPYDFQVPSLPKPEKKDIPRRTNWYKKGWDIFYATKIASDNMPDPVTPGFSLRPFLIPL
jgi:hypothetical protein